MITFDRALEFVLRYEGGICDDPRDSGGLTKFGISQKAYPALDIRALTLPEAKDIYRTDYWNACKCNELPAPLAIILFDSAVNQGTKIAIRSLQKALDVHVDGIVGPVTIAAAHRVSLGPVVSEFIARRAYQYALHPAVSMFGLGWYRRLAACYQLSQKPF